MANLTKRPVSKKPEDTKKADAFIAAAPDAAPIEPVKKRLIRGKKEQISHTIPPALLEKLDETASAKGLSRAGLINLAISEYLAKDRA